MISIIVLIFVSILRISIYRIIEPFCIRPTAARVLVAAPCFISRIFCIIVAAKGVLNCFFRLSRRVCFGGFIFSMLRCSIFLTSHTLL